MNFESKLFIAILKFKMNFAVLHYAVRVPNIVENFHGREKIEIDFSTDLP